MHLCQYGIFYLCKKLEYTNTNYYLCLIFTNTGSKKMKKFNKFRGSFKILKLN